MENSDAILVQRALYFLLLLDEHYNISVIESVRHKKKQRKCVCKKISKKNNTSLR